MLAMKFRCILVYACTKILNLFCHVNWLRFALFVSLQVWHEDSRRKSTVRNMNWPWNVDKLIIQDVFLLLHQLCGDNDPIPFHCRICTVCYKDKTRGINLVFMMMAQGELQNVAAADQRPMQSKPEYINKAPYWRRMVTYIIWHRVNRAWRKGTTIRGENKPCLTRSQKKTSVNAETGLLR